MSADLLNVEALTEELKRLKRRAAAALLLAAGSFAVAVLALVGPYNAGFRAYVERTLYTHRQAPRPPATSVEPSAVEAQRFVVRDKAGRIRAELGVETDDRAELSLRDPDGTLRAVLATADSGAGDGPENIGGRENTSLLGLFDRSGRRLATFEVSDDRSTPSTPRASVELWSARLWDKSPGGGGAMLIAGTESSNLYLSRHGGRVDLIVSDDSAPTLTMDDAAGRTRVDVSITGDSGPALNLSDKDGKLRAAFGSTALEVTKTGATEQTAESSLVLFDKKGKVMFRAPTD